MTIETVSLSDIGQFLVAIEAEMKANSEQISYLMSQVNVLKTKNETLHSLAKAILNNAAPQIMDY